MLFAKVGIKSCRGARYICSYMYLLELKIQFEREVGIDIKVWKQVGSKL